MSETQTAKPPIWYWIIGAIALLWNALGVIAFVMQMTVSEEAMQALPQAQQEMYANIPTWVTIAFAIAVFKGLFGSIALLLRKSWARMLFWASLVAVLVQMSYSFFFIETAGGMFPGAEAMPVMIIGAAIFLFMFAGFVKKKGWVS